MKIGDVINKEISVDNLTLRFNRVVDDITERGHIVYHIELKELIEYDKQLCKMPDVLNFNPDIIAKTGKLFIFK